ncbi:MAG: helix-turn-helix domain-containing protein [Janthinobacterium lividum]
MPTRSSTVFGALSASPSARVLHGMELGFGCAGTIWSNRRDRVAYHQPEGHTLSLYLRGGQGTRRLGRQGGHGHPGAVCLIPQGHSSEWEITGGFTFVHLYLPDAELRRLFVESFDRDARLMVLPELTFGDAPVLADVLGRLASAIVSGDAPAAEAALTDAVVASQRLDGARPPPPMKGGLAPHLCRRVGEHIDAQLDQPLRLRELATLAGMSAFHFQRSFCTSHGVSPQGWILRRRIDRARALLRGDAPIAQVAAACGFSSQSHMTRMFRSATGGTPAAYRKAALS